MSNHSLNRSLSTVSVGTVRAQNTDTTDRYNSTVLFYLFSFVFSFLFSFIITVSFCFSCLFLIPFSNLETKQVFFFFFFFFFLFFFFLISHFLPLLHTPIFSSLRICFLPWFSPKPFFPLIYSNFLEFAILGRVSKKPSCWTLCVHILMYPWLFLAESC